MEQEYVCPKCSINNDVESMYKIIGTIFECDECGERFNKPDIEHHCKRCDSDFDHTNSRYITIHDYYLEENTENSPEVDIQAGDPLTVPNE
jgi:hypothetical protein